MPIKVGVRRKKIAVELDVDQFERMAANFGFFSKEFLMSIDQAEKEIEKGEVHKLKSLNDLKK